MNVRLRYSLVGLILVASFIPDSLLAQITRLPSVSSDEEVVFPQESPSPPFPGRLVSHPNSSAEILQAPGEGDIAPATPPTDTPQLPPGVRNGFFQKALFDATWLAPGGSDGMGMNDLQSQVTCAMPCPTITSPLVLTSGFVVNYLQGPERAELPPQLYDAYVDFRWMSQLTPKLGVDLAITPGVWSDFEQESSKAFRLPGHGAAAWTWNDTTKLVLGAAYLDRPDVEVIAIGGVVWTPREDVKFDLVFPHPKIARRIAWGGGQVETVQNWAYIAGEFYGDAWAIKGADGRADQVVLSDYRLILGVEQKVLAGLSSRVELGYVFGRRIRYSSELPDFHPADTVMARGGLSY